MQFDSDDSVLPAFSYKQKKPYGKKNSSRKKEIIRHDKLLETFSIAKFQFIYKPRNIMQSVAWYYNPI